MMNLRFIIIVNLLIAQVSFACVNKTIVSSQKEFDTVVERINNGEKCKIELRPGLYKLNSSIVASEPLSIRGKNAVITCGIALDDDIMIEELSDYYVYNVEQPVSVFPLFYTITGQEIPISESVIEDIGVNYVEGELFSPDEYGIGVQIKIPISKNLRHLNNKTFKSAYGYFDCGWRTIRFKLNKTDSKYFYCTTLNSCQMKEFNYDKKVYKKKIRFVLYNTEMKPHSVYFDGQRIYIPREYSKVFYLNDSNTGTKGPTIVINSDVKLEGIRFVGITNVLVQSKTAGICEINKCSFQYSLGAPLTIKKENGKNVRECIISHCDFYDCAQLYDKVVMLTSSFAGQSCISMTDCRVGHYPSGKVMYKNTSGVVYVDGDVTLVNNVVFNTCRDHFYFYRGNIKATGNFLYNTDDFNSEVERNYSSDWGIVYCGYVFSDDNDALTNNIHHVWLENNLLYGAYAYGGDARGIFIDDGRGDVECMNNVILNTQLYSLDSRNVSRTSVSSVRNRYEGNILSSNYRLMAGASVSDSDLPVTSNNTLLLAQVNKTYKTIVLNEDKRILTKLDYVCSGEEIVVSEELYEVLKSSPAWKAIKKYVRIETDGDK